MTAHLFVYGTLLPGDTSDTGAEQRARLQREARVVGPGTTDGLLLDLGSYPGLVDGPGVVHGIVHYLPDWSKTLAWLDAYEGITGCPEDEYVRKPRAVTFSTGATILCWTYVYMQSMVVCSLIVSGRWSLRRSGQTTC